MSWRIFIAAALCVAIALFAAGAPPAAILLGIALVALLNYRNKRKSGTARIKNASKVATSSVSRTVNP